MNAGCMVLQVTDMDKIPHHRPLICDHAGKWLMSAEEASEALSYFQRRFPDIKYTIYYVIEGPDSEQR